MFPYGCLCTHVHTLRYGRTDVFFLYYRLISISTTFDVIQCRESVGLVSEGYLVFGPSQASKNGSTGSVLLFGCGWEGFFVRLEPDQKVDLGRIALGERNLSRKCCKSCGDTLSFNENLR